MEFTVRQSDLLHELELIQGATKKPTQIPVLQNILLKAELGELSVAGTDLEIALKSSCPSEVTTPGSITLPAKRLFEILRALPDQEVKFKKITDQWAMNVTCGRSRFRLIGLSTEDFPILAEAPTTETHRINSENLKLMIATTSFSISDAASKYTLSGAMLKLAPSGMIMVATDGHRLALAESTEMREGSAEPALVPQKALPELIRLINDSEDTHLTLSADATTLFFKIGKRQLMARKLVGQFPNYEAVMPKSNECIFEIDRQEFLDAIRRVALLEEERTKSIKLTIGHGGVEISSRSDAGEANETLAIDYQGELSASFNSAYLVQWAAAVDAGKVECRFKDEVTAAEFRATITDNVKTQYVVMPMRQ